MCKVEQLEVAGQLQGVCRRHVAVHVDEAGQDIHPTVAAQVRARPGAGRNDMSIPDAQRLMDLVGTTGIDDGHVLDRESVRHRFHGGGRREGLQHDDHADQGEAEQRRRRHKERSCNPGIHSGPPLWPGTYHWATATPLAESTIKL